MSWISGNCQGDRRFECYYRSFDGVDWCRDLDYPCPSVDDGGGLYGFKDHSHDSGGGW